MNNYGYELNYYPENSSLMERLSDFLSEEGNEQLDILDNRHPIDLSDSELIISLFLPVTKAFYEELRSRSINKKQAIKKTLNLVAVKFEIEQKAIAAIQRGEFSVIYFLEEEILKC